MNARSASTSIARWINASRKLVTASRKACGAVITSPLSHPRLRLRLPRSRNAHASAPKSVGRRRIADTSVRSARLSHVRTRFTGTSTAASFTPSRNSSAATITIRVTSMSKNSAFSAVFMHHRVVSNEYFASSLSLS
ncbi:unnamed protein product [Chondrus crispus]|uniref:Uncharacterized protein n=1 Tax=Chondrus crispus TaxID=2769 RepID=R7Q8W4_CHOCR|nr:unnamed protein product [Chondrus crispus]CDF33836.1 unnamed protein product [Chondrus crispus]|eukprot:XP_005713655.1 unnamed protein product [Chondrus crispus]